MVDSDVRLHILNELIAREKAPNVAETAAALGVGNDEIAAAYDQLAASRVIVLRPGTREIHMAAPFSAVPTGHVVKTNGHSYYANCVWDALGIIAMLHTDGDVHTACGDCESALELHVQSGELAPSDAVVHFAVPAARWWEDIVFT